jgi:hypothetical protein
MVEHQTLDAPATHAAALTRQALVTIHAIAILSIVLLSYPAAPETKAKFSTTWKAPGVAGVSYAGKKVVGLIVSDDLSLRMSAEEALARELTARGAQGVAAYRVIPREEIRNVDSAKRWFEQSGAAGVVVMRVVDLSKEKIPTAVVWAGATYGSFWNYYPYAWGSAIAIGPGRTETRVVVETLIFDIPGNRLLWGGTSETVDPKDAQATVKGIVVSAVERMKKDGLIRK